MYVTVGECFHRVDVEVAFSDQGDCVLVLMGCLFLPYSRCLQDNNWDYTRSAQAFTHLKVRFGNRWRKEISRPSRGSSRLWTRAWATWLY